MNPITKLIGAGENTHSQDQSITEVSFSVTNNTVTMITNKLFSLIVQNIFSKNYKSIKTLIAVCPPITTPHPMAGFFPRLAYAIA